MSSTVPCCVRLATRAPCFPGCVPRLSGRVGNVLSKVLSLLRRVARYHAAARKACHHDNHHHPAMWWWSPGHIVRLAFPCRVAGLRRRRSLRRSRRGGKAPITTPPLSRSRRISVNRYAHKKGGVCVFCMVCVGGQGFRTGEHWTKMKGGRKKNVGFWPWVGLPPAARTHAWSIPSAQKDMRLDVSSRRS